MLLKKEIWTVHCDTRGSTSMLFYLCPPIAMAPPAHCPGPRDAAAILRHQPKVCSPLLDLVLWCSTCFPRWSGLEGAHALLRWGGRIFVRSANWEITKYLPLL